MVQGAGYVDVSGRRYGLPQDLVKAAGAFAWGTAGEQYRSFLFLDSSSQPKGCAVAWATATANYTATAMTRASAGSGSTIAISASDAAPFIAATTGASNTQLFAGVLAEDKLGCGIYWVQVGGPVTLNAPTSAAAATHNAGLAWVVTTQATTTSNLSNAYRGSEGAVTVTIPQYSTAAGVSAAAATDIAIFQASFKPSPPGLYNMAAIVKNTSIVTGRFYLGSPDLHRQVAHS